MMHSLSNCAKLKQTKKQDSSKPYLNEAIIAAISTQFLSRSADLVQDYAEHFKPSTKDSDEPEIPDRMLAFASTGVFTYLLGDSYVLILSLTQIYAALHEWYSGNRVQADFSSNTFADVYKAHLQFLGEIQRQKPKAYRFMKATVFMRAS